MSKELRINRRFENLAQAQEAAKTELHNANRSKVSGTLTMMGNTTAQAGLNIEITDFGRLSGKYHIDTVTHSYTPSGGYVSTLTLRLGGPDAVIPSQAKDKTGQTSAIPDDGGTYE